MGGRGQRAEQEGFFPGVMLEAHTLISEAHCPLSPQYSQSQASALTCYLGKHPLAQPPHHPWIGPSPILSWLAEGTVGIGATI